jgi:MFS family permease
MTSKSAAQVAAPMYFGWYIVATCFFVSFLSTPGRQGFGLFVTEMEPTFGWDRSDISWVGSVGFLINGAMQPIMGALFDRYGPRRVFGTGLAIMGLAIMSLAFMQDLDHVVNLGVVHIPLDLLWFIGVFSIVINTCISAASITNMLALVVRWFRRKRSKATALAAAGTSIGGLLMIPFAAYMMSLIDESSLTIGPVELVGWRTVWFLLGTMVIFLAAPLAVFFLRPNPADLGLNPDGDPNPEDAPAGSAPQQRLSGLYEVSSWRQCFKTPPMWQLSGAYVVCGITTGLLSIHFIPYAEDVLPDTVHFLWMTFDDKKIFAALMFGVMTGLNAAGVIITGFMGDRMRRKNVLALVYATRGVAFMALVFLPLFGYGMLGLVAFALLSGMSWVASVPLTSTLTADVYGFRALGTISGWVFFSHQIGSFFSIQLAGYAYEWSGNSYFWPFLIAGLTLIPAAIMAYSIKEHHYSSRYNSRPADVDPQLATAAAGAAGRY